jgi:FecR-like protein
MITPCDSAKPSCGSSVPSTLVVVTTLFALLSCSWIGHAQAQTSAGTVTVLSGTASLQRAGNRLDVAVGTVVDVGDQITVSSGHLTITLTDGSLLKAGSTSVLVIDEQLLGPGGAVASTKIGLLAGILRAIDRHTSSGSPANFQVHTPNAILSVRGTKFDTSYSEGARRYGFGDSTRFTDVKTYEGRVGARNAALPSSEETMVNAGYETTIAGDSPPLSPGPLGMTGIPFGDVDTFVGDAPGSAIAPPPAPPPAPPAPPAPALPPGQP